MIAFPKLVPCMPASSELCLWTFVLLLAMAIESTKYIGTPSLYDRIRLVPRMIRIIRELSNNHITLVL